MIVDLVNDTVTATLTAASNGLDEPVGFRISPDGNYGYVANLGTNQVLKLDLATNATIASFPVAGAFYIGITPDGSKLAVSRQNGNAIAIVDTSTGATTQVPLNGSPFSVLINNAGTKIYAAGANKIWVVDIATLNVTTVNTPSGGTGNGIGILPDDSRVYVAQQWGNRIDVLDTTTNTLLTPISVPNEPLWITVSPDGSTIWTPQYATGANSVARISTATNTVVATLPTPNAPQSYLTGITADGAKVYVFGYAPGTNVVDPATNAVTLSAWTAPADPWDFQTCPFATPPSPPTTSGSTSTSPDPVIPTFAG